MRAVLTRAEWLGLQEYNRRLLPFWREAGECLPWLVVQRELEAAAPRVAREVVREGFQLPPRMVRKYRAEPLRPNLFQQEAA